MKRHATIITMLLAIAGLAGCSIDADSGEEELVGEGLQALTLPPGLVHLWSGEGDALDSVGSAHGTLGATTAFAPGVNGQAFDFDAAQSSIVGLPVDIGPSAQPQITFGMWVRLDSVANNRGWVFGHDNGGFDRAINLTDTRYGSGVAGGTGVAPHGSTLINQGNNLGQWVCVAAVYDAPAQTAMFYAAGATQTVFAAPASGLSTATLGGLALSVFNSHTIDGQVDEVFLYNRTLSTAEIDQACELLAQPDTDGDGVHDDTDQCLSTPAGEVVDPSTGCSVEEACPCENAWENHGAYVSCVAHATNTLVGMGLITGAEKGAIMAEAGASSCGKKK